MSAQSLPNAVPPPAQMLQLIIGEFAAKAVTVAAQLDLAEHLHRGPLKAEELAKAVEADSQSLYRLLRALASVGIFEEHEDGRFSNTGLSDTLRGSAPGSLRWLAMFLGGAPMGAAWQCLEYSIRSGRSGFVRAHGSHPFEYMQTHAEFAHVFDQAMTGLSEQDVAAIHAKFDFSGIETLVDVGGGHGALLASCLQRNPKQRGVLFDRGSVLGRARTFVEAAGVAERCKLVEGDFLKEVPAGADAYMLKYVLHDWSDAEATTILKNIHRAARRGAKLLVIDPIIKPGNTPDFGKLLDVQVLVFYGNGRERTHEEFSDLLGSAGFRIARTVETDSALSLIEAERE